MSRTAVFHCVDVAAEIPPTITTWRETLALPLRDDRTSTTAGGFRSGRLQRAAAVSASGDERSLSRQTPRFSVAADAACPRQFLGRGQMGFGAAARLPRLAQFRTRDRAQVDFVRTVGNAQRAADRPHCRQRRIR